jgi:hypothetical protein
MEKRDPDPRPRLTSLFQDRQASKTIRSDMVSLHYAAANSAEIQIKLTSPDQAAAYIRMALSPRSSQMFALFNQPHYRCPLVLLGYGEIYDSQTRHISNDNRLLRIRFFDDTSPSEICFDDDFADHKSERADTWSDGPPLTEFMKILQKAGAHWNKMDFNPPRTTTLRLVHGS